MAEFDIERFVQLSKAVDLSDIDWKEATAVGITDEEYRVVRYMADTELHTILYLRDLLHGHIARDPEVTQFLACWVYEETHHGRALEEFLAKVGRPTEPDRFQSLVKQPTVRESMGDSLFALAATVSPLLAATHMCWGAANELTAAASYQALAERTPNAQLAKLVNKLQRDERKHFSFYFHQSQKRLVDGGWRAQAICKLAMSRFWQPTGLSVGGLATLEFITSYLFGSEEGRESLRAVDTTIGKLPDMDWFHGVQQWTDAARDRFRKAHPADYERHRREDRQIGAVRAPVPAAVAV
jgi:hypothetical protein